MVGIALLGPLSVDGLPAPTAPRDRMVLGALALRLGEVVSAERLADALWGERPPTSWNKVVQGCVVRVRKLLGPGAIETLPQGYRLVLARDDVDARRFERLLGRARELLTLGEPERAAYLIGEALALWQGRALVDLEGWGPGRTEAARLEELRLDAEELGLDAAMRAGRHREVLAEAESRVAEVPLREHRWALLALAQYQAGQQGDALRTLHRARGARHRAGTRSRSRPRRTRAGDPATRPVARSRDGGLRSEHDLPVPGSRPLRRRRRRPLLRTRRGRGGVRRDGSPTPASSWSSGRRGRGSRRSCGPGSQPPCDARVERVVVITPGARPMDALTWSSSSGPAPVLVVDQCEEVMTLCHDGDERARFFAALVAHAEHALLVVAMRADRVGDVSAHPEFARLVERSLHLLGAMDDPELRAAIEGPAHQAGLLLEPGLVDLLARDVEREPGALPLLSHALRRPGSGARARRSPSPDTARPAASAGRSRSRRRRSTSRRRPSSDASCATSCCGWSRPAPKASRYPRAYPGACSPPIEEHERLIELLVAARLVTSDDGMVELAHEAIARAWPRLRGWLDDDVEGQRILRHLTMAADTWDAMARPDSELYRGVRLAQALDWRS